MINFMGTVEDSVMCYPNFPSMKDLFNLLGVLLAGNLQLSASSEIAWLQWATSLKVILPRMPPIDWSMKEYKGLPSWSNGDNFTESFSVRGAIGLAQCVVEPEP